MRVLDFPTELPLPVVGKLQHVAIPDPPSHPWVAPKIEEPPETSTLEDGVWCLEDEDPRMRVISVVHWPMVNT